MLIVFKLCVGCVLVVCWLCAGSVLLVCWLCVVLTPVRENFVHMDTSSLMVKGFLI